MLVSDTMDALGEPCAEGLVILAAEPNPSPRGWDNP